MSIGGAFNIIGSGPAGVFKSKPGAVPFVGLLDTYPNAAAAYSLRRLRAAYSGSTIRVRRSSDNAEQDIGFTNNVLDTASLLTFCGAGNGFVVTWYDQSGNNRDVTQTTAANQPQIVASGVVLLRNSLPCLRFDGTNDRLITSSNFTLIPQPFTFTTVSKENDANDAIVGSSTNVSGSKFVQYMVVGYTLFNNSNLNSGIANTLNNKVLTSVSISPNSRMWLNQTAGTAGNSGPDGIENIQISGYYNSAQFLGGDFQEGILWPSNQSSNVLAINQLIQNYYGI